MSVLLALENARAAFAVTEYAAVLGHEVEVAFDVDEASRLARFRGYTTVICDASFEGAYCLDGLGIAHAAKLGNRDTRTVVLATWYLPALQEALARGDVDAALIKPQPLSRVFAIVEWGDGRPERARSPRRADRPVP